MIELTQDERDALERADDLYDEVLDADSVAAAERHAYAALRESPLHADSYVSLAMLHADRPTESLFFWRAALIAAELALGKETMTELKGQFWGFMETRPYMRAKHGLAMTLWEQGERAEAIKHLNEMLRLNPNDNQGVRYQLVSMLLEESKDADAAKLHKRYKGESTAFMRWPKVLLDFRTGGPELARAALVEAMEANSHVPAYLGGKRLPKEEPDYYEIGSADEAALYVLAGKEAWTRTAGALEWLAGEVPKKRGARA